MDRCVTCKTIHGLLELVIEGNEDTGGEDYSLRVCDTCWEAVAGIAQRANNWKFNEMQKKIDALMVRLDELENHEVSPYEATMIVERSKIR